MWFWLSLKRSGFRDFKCNGGVFFFFFLSKNSGEGRGERGNVNVVEGMEINILGFEPMVEILID